MSKKSLSLLLLLSLALNAQASTFSGFYIGANTGYAYRKDKNTFTASNKLEKKVNYSKTISNSDFAYGVMGGYGQNINGFYLGAELTISHDNTNKDHILDLQTFNGLTINGSSKYKRGIAFGISPRLGAVLADSYLLYARLGIEVSRDKTYANVPGFLTIYASSEQTKTVLVPGIGIEKDYGNNFLGRLEYNYTTGSRINTSTNCIGGITLNHTIKYSSQSVKAGIAYKF
jgi:outer membrane immunogenic protein